MIPAGVFNQGSDYAMIVEVRVSGSGAGLGASIYPFGATNIEVDWGDGSFESFTTAGVKTHFYASSGTYSIKITGELEAFGQVTTTNKDKVYDIKSWGDLGLTSLSNACRDMVNLTSIPQGLPKGVTATLGMFWGATSFNQDISGWDVSNVTDMIGMFNGATSFNQDLSGWCVINIPTAPTNFANSTPSWTLPKPVWGTCP